jgi:hypothetical protein
MVETSDVIIFKPSPEAAATCNLADGLVVPIPTLPPEAFNAKFL